MARVVLGVTGGIAAYKSANLIRLLAGAGHDVHVVLTKNATRFIGEVTLEALSHNKVHVVDPDLFTDAETVKHVELGKKADLIIVAPATASFLARVAVGISDDLLTTTLLTADCPILLAPAMHTEMWTNAATAQNITTLVSRGFEFVGPNTGRLTGSDSGVGRLSEPEEIFSVAEALLSERLLVGKRVVVTAGGTREPIDSVRFIGNYSSGKQGLAFAREASRQGANVVLVACNLEAATWPGVEVIDVQTTSELMGVLKQEVLAADLVVMAAAVSDFSPEEFFEGKLHRTESNEPTLRLLANPDVLKTIVEMTNRSNPRPIFVGFAAEIGQQLEQAARRKLESKGCDFVIANDVSGGKVFGEDSNEVILVSSDSTQRFAGTKEYIAKECMSAIAGKLRVL